MCAGELAERAWLRGAVTKREVAIFCANFEFDFPNGALIDSRKIADFSVEDSGVRQGEMTDTTGCLPVRGGFCFS